MPISLTDHRCLRPRWLAPGTRASGHGAHRVDGLLHRAEAPERPRLIEAVDYDGARCRYRALDAIRPDGEWLLEQRGDEYRSCAQTIVERLRMLGQAETDRLSVLDSLVSSDGRLWIAVKNEAQRRSRWVAVTGRADQGASA